MATLAERLTDAEAAYHELLLGRGVFEFQDQNGERVRYTPANRSDLLVYINWLKTQNVACPVGPLRVFI